MPYGRMRMKTTKINPRSPYGRLLLEKQEVERLCELQEQQIAADVRFCICVFPGTAGRKRSWERGKRKEADGPGLAAGAPVVTPLGGRRRMEVNPQYVCAET